MPAGTRIVGGGKKKKGKILCKEEEKDEYEMVEVEVENEENLKEEKKEELKEEEKKILEKEYLCKKVAIDWHGVLADSDNRVSEDSLCAVEKLLAKGIKVTILSYGGHDRNKQTLACLKELRIFEEIEYQFCGKKTGQSGKAAWMKHLGLGAIFDDDAKINKECLDRGLAIFPIIGKSGDHKDLGERAGGTIIPSHNLRDAIDLFLQM